MQWGPIRSLKVTVDEIIQVTADNEKQRYSMKPAHPPPADDDGGQQQQTTTTTAAEPGHWLIRANQGHSIQLASEALLAPITLADDNVPPVVVHGTYFAFWPRIVASGGLRRMGRNHVHCSTGLPPTSSSSSASNSVVVVSGMRHDAELLVYIDVRRSLEDGAMAWWRSDNGVVLTEGAGEDGLVPAKYFKEVVGRRRQRQQKDQEKEDDDVVEVGTLWKDGVWVADLPEAVKSRPPPSKGRGGGGGGGGRGQGGRGRGGRGRGQGRGGQSS